MVQAFRVGPPGWRRPDNSALFARCPLHRHGV